LSWLGLTIAAAAAQPWWGKLVLGIAVGVVAAPCFVVGHDACHGSLTPYAWLNKVIGRIAFLPALHPFSSWEHTHNGLHHGWTNVRGHEIAYVPFTKAEYDQLSPWRQAIERFYRSPLGTGAFYFFTVWIPHEMFPVGLRLPSGRRRRTFKWDRLLVLAFLSCWLVVLSGLARSFKSNVATTLLFGVGVAFATFNVVIGTVTVLHHTHPAVPWYDGSKEYDYFDCQVRASVHLELPRLFEIFLQDVLQHTAHHVDARIPLYHLAESQAQLRRAYPDDIQSEPWSWRGYLRVFRTCRLFDYNEHRWLDYDGTPLTSSLLPCAPRERGG
jgi:omega-6 fatty acid desaturase (delta-12 desaturase)